jgi:hypothetical protein
VQEATRVPGPSMASKHYDNKVRTVQIKYCS